MTPPTAEGSEGLTASNASARRTSRTRGRARHARPSRATRASRGALAAVAALTVAGAGLVTPAAQALPVLPGSSAPAPVSPAPAHLLPAGSAGVELPVLSSGPGLQFANPLDELGRPRPEILEQVREFARQPWIPPEVRDVLLSAVAYFAGEGSGGVTMPADAPPFKQFYWPTVAGNCIGGQLDSVGSALAVRGPAHIPAPGAAPGQTTFLFTAMGTAPAAPEQGGMQVRWANLATLAHGATPLGNHGINPEGPATVSGVADTGEGPVVAILDGTVHTGDGPCTFQPTAAFLPGR